MTDAPPFEHATEAEEDDDFLDDLSRQWDPGIDAFVVGSSEHTGFCSWFWGIFSPKCKSCTTLVAGESKWFRSRIDPSLGRPILGQPVHPISMNPEHEYGEYGRGLPVVQTTVGQWKSMAFTRWKLRFIGLLCGLIAWVMTGDWGTMGDGTQGPLWLFAAAGWLIGHEISLRFIWQIRGPLDLQKFRLQRRCWWAFCDGLWLLYLKRLNAKRLV